MSRSPFSASSSSSEDDRPEAGADDDTSELLTALTILLVSTQIEAETALQQLHRATTELENTGRSGPRSHAGAQTEAAFAAPAPAAQSLDTSRDDQLVLELARMLGALLGGDAGGSLCRCGSANEVRAAVAAAPALCLLRNAPSAPAPDGTPPPPLLRDTAGGGGSGLLSYTALAATLEGARGQVRHMMSLLTDAAGKMKALQGELRKLTTADAPRPAAPRSSG
jgi:hypothetical protein